MSTSDSLQEPQPTKPTLRVVPAERSSHAWSRGSFPILILALLAVGMISHLVLQTKIQEQGFELSALQTQADHLVAEQAVKQAALDSRSTSRQLVFEASQLGMVVNPYSTFLVLPKGQIKGVKKVVKGNEVPLISAIPTPDKPVVDTVNPAQPSPSASTPGVQP